MNSRRQKPYSDLWTEAAKAMGIRVSGERSPFRPIETKQDARGLARDASLVLFLVGLVQISLSWMAGVGSSLDALVYMPLAVLVYRFASRLAAGLLVAFVIVGAALPAAAAVMKIGVRTDLIVLAVLLWASLRSFEATLLVHARAGVSGSSGRRTLRAEVSEPFAGDGAAVLGAHARGSGWLFWAGLAFLVAAASTVVPRVVGSIRRPPSASIATTTRPAAPQAVDSGVSVRLGDDDLRVSAPAAFIEPRREEPETGKLAEAFVAPTMKLLALFVSPADLESFRRDHQFAPARYVMVEAPRDASGKTSTADFRTAKDQENEEAASHRIAHLIGADEALSRWLDAVYRRAGDVTDVAGLKVRSEGVLEETDRSVSLGAVTEVASSSGGTTGNSRVVVTSLVLVRGKLLVVYSYGSYEKPDDVVAVHEIARQTVRNLINENPA
jgi:hypothetical protein